MLTLEKLTAAAQELPAEFSLGQLVDRLLALDIQPPSQNKTSALATALPEETILNFAKKPASAAIKALRGIARELPPADLQKSAKEWEAARIQEKYSV